MDFTRKLSFLVFLLCVLISLKNQNAETKKGSQQYTAAEWSPSSSPSPSDADSIYLEASSSSELPSPSSSYRMVTATDVNVDSSKQQERSNTSVEGSLRYDYYNESCPYAEQIIRETVRELHRRRHGVAPAFLRLVFHDCFVEGCDASVLLDPAEGINSEKESPPNQSLKGFDLIDLIKSEVEEACPGVVSCADILVLAARESVILAGGPFYPLYTGRRDSNASFGEVATYELPNPQDDLAKITESFASRGFDERETVSLLGAHSTGMIHCKFFRNRLYNFSRTGGPDPSMDREFLNRLREKCGSSHTSVSPSASPSQSPESSTSIHSLSSASSQNPGVKMDYEGPGSGFGTLYYRSLLQGKGLLYVDQQLTAGEETLTWVRAYASDVSLFQRDFTLTMIKLSNLHALTVPQGQVRLNCRKVAG